MGERPAIVIATHRETDMYVVIPMTAQRDANRFPNTYEVQTSVRNRLDTDSVALIFQIRCLCRERFLRRIGTLDTEDHDNICHLVRNFLHL